MDLSLDQHGVHHAADVVDDGVPDYRHDPGLLVDLHLAHLTAVGKRHGRRRERGPLAEARLHSRGKPARLIRGARDRVERHTAIGPSYAEPAAPEDDVVGSGLEEMRNDETPALDRPIHGPRDRRAANTERAGAAVATAGVERIAVAREHLEPRRWHAEPVAHDLGERGLVALSH